MSSIKKLLQRVWVVLFILAALYFAYSWFRDDAGKAAKLLSADLGLLGAAALSHVAYFIVTVLAWCGSVRLSGERAISFREGLSQILLVNFGKYIPGKIWGIAARAAKLKTLGYSLHEITRASYLEQVLLLLTGFWLAFLAAFLVYEHVIYIALLLLVSIVLVMMKNGRAVIEFLVRIFPSTRTALAYVDVKIGTAHFSGLAFAYILVWLTLSASFVFVSLAVMPLETSFHNIVVFVLCLTAGYLGIREGVGAGILALLVPLQDAILLMLIFRVWVVFWELLAGCTLLIPHKRRGSNVNVD